MRMIRMPKYKYYFALSDFIVLSVSFLISAYLMGKNKTVGMPQTGIPIPEIVLFLVLSVSTLYVFEKNNLYKINVILKRTVHITALSKSLFFASFMTFTAFILFYSGSLSATSLITMIFVFSASLLFYFLRIEVYRRMILKKRNNFFRKSILIIGAGKSGKLLAEGLTSENPYGINIIGFLDDNKINGNDVYNGKKILGNIDQLKQIAEKYYLDEVILAIDNISYERLMSIVDLFNGLNVNVKVSSERFRIVKKNYSKERYGGFQVVDVTPAGNKELILKIKRVIDVFGASIGLILLSPLLLILIILIKISSPGPILFKQTRIGKDGKPFMFYKFRSMKVMNGEDEERKKMMIDFMKNRRSHAEDTKIINDKRVTWIGKFIRRTSIDELPQLFNVIKGDMSLVGPRPSLPYEYENYENWQRRRVDVLPGCTGVWQVSGRSKVSFNDSIMLDLYYINNLSLLLDIRILLKTIPVMFFSKGGK
jgi:exopolysaccharide biosynthesis polyprenyl glycosylphosphotransferase